jgi:hypothetical protein
MMRFGLILATLGGLALVIFCGALVANAPLPRATDMHSMEIMVMLASVQIAGFAVAILAALRNGFGALDRFFQAALARSTPPSPPVREPAPLKLVRRGAIGARAYALFEDGSVEAETLLGLRRFRSFAEAVDFIGA